MGVVGVSGRPCSGTVWASSTTGRRSTRWPSTTSRARWPSTGRARCCTATWAWCCRPTASASRHSPCSTRPPTWSHATHRQASQPAPHPFLWRLPPPAPFLLTHCHGLRVGWCCLFVDQARFQKANVLMKMQRYEEALVELEKVGKKRTQAGSGRRTDGRSLTVAGVVCLTGGVCVCVVGAGPGSSGGVRALPLGQGLQAPGPRQRGAAALHHRPRPRPQGLQPRQGREGGREVGREPAHKGGR